MQANLKPLIYCMTLSWADYEINTEFNAKCAGSRNMYVSWLDNAYEARGRLTPGASFTKCRTKYFCRK